MLIDDFISDTAGGSPEGVRLFWWQGWSARYHIMSIFDLKKLDCRVPGVFLVVRREPCGARTPLFAGIAHSISDDLYDDYGDALLHAIAAGANEIHVNLAAETLSARLALLSDLEAGWGLTHYGPRIPLPVETPPRAFEEDPFEAATPWPARNPRSRGRGRSRCVR